MKYASLIMLLAVSTALVSADDVAWSSPVKGLRARLAVLPAEKPDSPFCRVFIEFQNMADVAGQMNIRFSPGKLTLRVLDGSGKELPPPAAVIYDGMTPLWEPILLPYSGTLSFQVSFPGLGYDPATDKVIVDLGTSQCWVIPQDGKTYYLSGTFTIQREKSDHPHIDWSGTLELPKVEIPRSK